MTFHRVSFLFRAIHDSSSSFRVNIYSSIEKRNGRPPVYKAYLVHGSYRIRIHVLFANGSLEMCTLLSLVIIFTFLL
jgi:hypothetical protein